MDTKKYLLKPSQLRKTCKPSIFKFENTAELEIRKGIIGQKRALCSLELGLDMNIPGYNIYLSGPLGTGKVSLARVMLEEKAAGRNIPSDWCYLYNFKKPDCPRALQLPAGSGREFTRDISNQVDKMIRNIVKAFEGDDFESQKTRLLGSLGEETSSMYMHLEEEARDAGFTISQNQGGLSSVPLKDGEALSQEDYMAMSDEEKQDLRKRGFVIQEKLNEAFRQYKEMERKIRGKIKNLEQETVRTVTSLFFAFLFDKYRKDEAVVAYLEDMQQDLLDNTEMFIKQDDNPAANFFRNFNRRNSLRRYQVNLFVDNSSLTKAPVIFESNPTFSNLFGQIEYEGEFGVLATDFSKIKPGSIHRANGGYLVLNVIDVLRNFYVWDSLKRVLKTGESCVESISRMYGISNSETLQPDPIPIDIKVVLIGEPLFYYLLYNQDEDFQKIFKIKADFDIEMGRTRRSIQEYARFIASVCRQRKLRHLKPEAVAEVVDYGSRMAGDQEKLSTQFNRLVEVIYEADHWAARDKAAVIDAPHIKKAITEKNYRSSMYEDKIQEIIARHVLMINTAGLRVGEINGLAVYEMGDYSFGKPVRITAKAFMGERGLVNIEREIRMSGSIHSKGVLTMSGYMGAQYAQDKPLCLSASLTFEQSYQGIEGDSASSAELYALLSAISGVSIHQGIAVTGSVNQNGEIQPIGGVNQKIEGYYRVCLGKGLDGSQGVVIPRQNISHLMLSDEVIAAVKKRLFYIWAVEHIDEGIEILTGLPAGQRGADGTFPPGSVHYLVNKKLEEWNNRSKRSLNGYERKLRNYSNTLSRRRDL